MAQIRIERRRTGPIWLAVIITVLVIALAAVWYYAKHRTATPPVVPASSGAMAAPHHPAFTA